MLDSRYSGYLDMTCDGRELSQSTWPYLCLLIRVLLVVLAGTSQHGFLVP